MVGNEGTDTNHLRLQFTDKGQVFEQISHCLPGRAYHKASADLITQFFEIAQAAFAVTQFEFWGAVVHNVRYLLFHGAADNGLRLLFSKADRLHGCVRQWKV